MSGPKPPSRPARLNLVLAALLIGQTTAAGWRRKADELVAAGKLTEASAAFARAGALYGKLGDPNAAKVLADLADRYRTEVRYYRSAPPESRPGGRPLARLEPAAGCYLGAFIDRQDEIEAFSSDNREHGEPLSFARIAGRHASYFTYIGYGSRFPREWVRRVHAAGAIAHIALEPRGLGQVRPDAQLDELARELAAARGPIFLRFAGEMNGAWTPYSADPTGYRAMFRMVAGAVRDRAPNVAMVWCPNEIPEAGIEKYYPGDDVVDWVGLNFYSVVYQDADRARGSHWRRPDDALAKIYQRYSSRHPIMIGEWAATRRSTVDYKPRPEFAIQKMAELYASLPLRYPRVKAVHWLSMDTIRYAMPGRRLNDYSLLGDATVESAYRLATNDPWYLRWFGESASNRWIPLSGTAKKGEPIRAWARFPEGRGTVRYNTQKAQWPAKIEFIAR